MAETYEERKVDSNVKNKKERQINKERQGRG